MTMIHKTALLGAIAAAAMTVPAAAQSVPAAKIALVDTGRIYAECTACKAAQTQLQTQTQTLQQRAQALNAPLQTEEQGLETALKALNGKQPDSALQGRIQAFQTKRTAAQQELATGQRNLQSIQAHVLQQVNTQLRPIIQSAMTSSGANIVMDKSASLFNADAVDITTTVLNQLNQRLPSVSVTPLPQQAQPAAPAQPSR